MAPGVVEQRVCVLRMVQDRLLPRQAEVVQHPLDGLAGTGNQIFIPHFQIAAVRRGLAGTGDDVQPAVRRFCDSPVAPVGDGLEVRGSQVAAVADDVDEMGVWPDRGVSADVLDPALKLQAPPSGSRLFAAEFADGVDEQAAVFQGGQIGAALGHQAGYHAPHIVAIETETLALHDEVTAIEPLGVNGVFRLTGEPWIAEVHHVAHRKDVRTEVDGFGEVDFGSDHEIGVRVEQDAEQSGAGAVFTAEQDGVGGQRERRGWTSVPVRVYRESFGDVHFRLLSHEILGDATSS